MENRTKAILGGRPLDIEGVYTKEAISIFSSNMPEVPVEEFHEGLTNVEFPRLFRVATMINLIMRLKEENE
jgi:hypothetical protein